MEMKRKEAYALIASSNLKASNAMSDEEHIALLNAHVAVGMDVPAASLDVLRKQMAERAPAGWVPVVQQLEGRLRIGYKKSNIVEFDDE